MNADRKPTIRQLVIGPIAAFASFAPDWRWYFETKQGWRHYEIVSLRIVEKPGFVRMLNLIVGPIALNFALLNGRLAPPWTEPSEPVAPSPVADATAGAGGGA